MEVHYLTSVSVGEKREGRRCQEGGREGGVRGGIGGKRSKEEAIEEEGR